MWEIYCPMGLESLLGYMFSSLLTQGKVFKRINFHGIASKRYVKYVLLEKIFVELIEKSSLGRNNSLELPDFWFF